MQSIWTRKLAKFDNGATEKTTKNRLILISLIKKTNTKNLRPTNKYKIN